MQRKDALTQTQVLELLKVEGLGAGIASSSGTISAFVDVPMYSVVAFRQESNKWGGFYDRNEVNRFISDYRAAKAGKSTFEGR